MDTMGFTRRWMIEAGALGGAVMASPALAATDYDPRKTSAGIVKLEAYLDGRAAPWWYVGTIYAVREHTKPQALVRFEGCETYWANETSNGEADGYSRTLTFFRDIVTDQWLDAYDNPFTGQRNTIKPNILGGALIYPADGSQPRFKTATAVSQSAPQGFDPPDPSKPSGSFRWVMLNDMVLRIGDRSAPTKFQPSMEVQSSFGSSKAFFDPRVKSMGAQFTSTTFSPYLGWMQMGDQPGHLIWHASGHKLGSFADLPDTYRRRAEEVKPGMLTAPPG